MKTLVDIVSKFRRRDKIALKYKSGFRTFSLSYAELYDKIVRTCFFFEQLGIKKGDKVILWGYNSSQWGIAFLAAAIRGIVIVPVDYIARGDYVERVQNIVKAKLILHSEYKIPPKCNFKEVVLEHLDKKIEGFDFAKFDLYGAGVLEDDLLEIVFTSGTTGDPKGVLLTHKNLISNILSVQKQFVLDSDHTFLSMLPMSHLFEQNPGFLVPLTFGCTIVYVKSLSPHVIFKVLSEEGITNIVIVPRLLQLFADRIKREAEAEGKLKFFNKLVSLSLPRFVKRRLFRRVHLKFGKYFRYFIVGGAMLTWELEDFWRGMGFVVIQGYGLTECSPVLTVNPLEEQRVGSVGVILPDVGMRVLKDGEICVRGENVTSGYYKDRVRTRELFDGEWMRTGDLGEVDEEGFVYLKGRKKDVIIASSGVNVYPEDIEEELMKDRRVKEVCVLGLPTKEGERVHAELILKSSVKNFKSVIKDVNKRLNDSQQIVSYAVWGEEDFPRTTTMKIKKYLVLGEILRRGEGLRVSKPKVKEGSKLYSCIAQICGVDVGKIKPSSKLSLDLKLSSIDRVELVSLIEQEFSVDIDEDLISGKSTVGQLEDLISARRKFAERRVFRAWLLWPIFRVLRFVCNFLIGENVVRFFCRRKVVGRENLKGLRGQVIFVANHVGFFDAPNILMSLPFGLRNRVAMAALEEFFVVPKKRFFKWLLYKFFYLFASLFYNIYLFGREKGFKRSLEYTGELLDRDWNILFFPEGRHSKNGRLQPFMKGIGLIVKEMRVPVVPVKHFGLENVMKGDEYFPKFGKVLVKIGKPVKLDYTKSAFEITNELQKLIEKM